MHDKLESYRALELLCRAQAALSATPGAKSALQLMALEYKRLGDWLEHQWTEAEPPK